MPAHAAWPVSAMRCSVMAEEFGTRRSERHVGVTLCKLGVLVF
jgi:hypothetical protein